MKTQAEIETKIKELTSSDILTAPCATIDTNQVLALSQTHYEGWLAALR